jgi:hypothetical protein
MEAADEVWHAGDIGNIELQLQMLLKKLNRSRQFMAILTMLMQEKSFLKI